MPETKTRGRPPRKKGEILDAFVGIRLSRQMLDGLSFIAEQDGVTRNELILGALDRVIRDADKRKRNR